MTEHEAVLILAQIQRAALLPFAHLSIGLEENSRLRMMATYRIRELDREIERCEEMIA